MYCPKCGTEAGNSRYCSNCGANMNTASFRPIVTNGNGKKINKIVFGILAVGLGAFGAHRFYAGKIGSGIMYLLFCWTGIPTILGIAEGVTVLCRDSNITGEVTVDKSKFFV